MNNCNVLRYGQHDEVMDILDSQELSEVELRCALSQCFSRINQLEKAFELHTRNHDAGIMSQWRLG